MKTTKQKTSKEIAIDLINNNDDIKKAIDIILDNNDKLSYLKSLSSNYIKIICAMPKLPTFYCNSKMSEEENFQASLESKIVNSSDPVAFCKIVLDNKDYDDYDDYLDSISEIYNNQIAGSSLILEGDIG